MNVSDARNVENGIDSSPEIRKNTKRRSAVFKRQSLVAVENEETHGRFDDEVVSCKPKKKKELLIEENQSEIFNIENYIESLRKETHDWREEYKKRKSKVIDLTKQVEHLERVGQLSDISCLSDSKRAFLSLKPNYKEFIKSVEQLQTLATKVAYFNLYTKNYCDKSVLKLQDGMDDAKHRIIKLTD